MEEIIWVPLTMEQQAELARIRTGDVCPVTSDLRKQLNMVDLSDRGWTAPQIALDLGVSQETVCECLKAFLHGGFKALPAWWPAARAGLVVYKPRGRFKGRSQGIRLALPGRRLTSVQMSDLLQSLDSMTNNLAQMQRLLGLVQDDALMLERLLNLIGSAADVERFLVLLGGNARVLVKATRFFDGGAEIRKIMAAATTVAIDPASLVRLFAMAQANGWSKADNVVEFLTKVHGASPRPSWQDALDWTDLFHAHNVESIAYKSGSTTTLATAASYADLALAGGPRRISIMEYDLNHFLTGHTFEDFVMSGTDGIDNINRGASSTLWPIGTSVSTILADARQAVLDPAMIATIKPP